MTLEQKLRNACVDGKLEGFTIMISYSDLSEIKPHYVTVIEDKEGILMVNVWDDVVSQIKFLNGNKYYDTHEEAFQAEL